MSHAATRVAVNDVSLHVLHAGSGFPVLLCHGFPELAYSWRHQLPALADAGYHAIAPDQRGYGQSSRPDDVEAYDIDHLTGDMVALLDAMGYDRAVVVGHDWGSMVAWTLAQRYPNRFAGVVGMSVPFVPRGPRPLIQSLRKVFGDDSNFYIVYFQEPGVADAELGADAATTMRRVLSDLKVGAQLSGTGTGTGFIGRLPEPSGLPDWLTQDELDHYIAEFTRTGFTGGINWYRNLDRNWHLTEDLAGAKVEIPAAFIGGADDPVLLMTPLSVMDGWLSDLRGATVVEGAGHWVQQEKPAEVNAALLEFLASLDL